MAAHPRGLALGGALRGEHGHLPVGGVEEHVRNGAIACQPDCFQRAAVAVKHGNRTRRAHQEAVVGGVEHEPPGTLVRGHREGDLPFDGARCRIEDGNRSRLAGGGGIQHVDDVAGGVVDHLAGPLAKGRLLVEQPEGGAAERLDPGVLRGDEQIAARGVDDRLVAFKETGKSGRAFDCARGEVDPAQSRIGGIEDVEAVAVLGEVQVLEPAALDAGVDRAHPFPAGGIEHRDIAAHDA